jgi:hypothetical protein
MGQNVQRSMKRTHRHTVHRQGAAALIALALASLSVLATAEAHGVSHRRVAHAHAHRSTTTTTTGATSVCAAQAKRSPHSKAAKKRTVAQRTAAHQTKRTARRTKRAARQTKRAAHPRVVKASPCVSPPRPGAGHGMPAGVPVPSWATQPGQHPYFMPSPAALAEGSEASPTAGAPSQTAAAGTAAAGTSSPAASASASGSKAAPNGEPTPGAGGLSGPLAGSTSELDAGGLAMRSGMVPPLEYRGGSVQRNPQLKVIFWGGNWGTAGLALREELLHFFYGLSGSAEQGILTQYFDKEGNISAYVNVEWATDERVAAPTGVNERSVEREVEYAETRLGSHTPETQYVVIPAPYTRYEKNFAEGFCAYHSYINSTGAVFSLIPYAGDEPFVAHGCDYYGGGEETQLDFERATEAATSHEYAEATTDPIWETATAGWQGPLGGQDEIADMCATTGDELPSGVWVQGWWDDHQGRCSESDAWPPHILALTRNASEVSATGATLNGIVNAEGQPTSYQFEWGPTTAYGSKAPAAMSSVGSSWANVQVQARIPAPPLGATYHFRVVASNASGTSYGEDRTVTGSQLSPVAFQAQPSWGQNRLDEVSCVNQNMCMAVGWTGVTEGGYTTYQPLFDKELNGVWQATTLALPASEFTPEMNGVACVSDDDCTAVGQAFAQAGNPGELAERVPLIAHWNGAEWSWESLPLPVEVKQVEIERVACIPGGGECIAVGDAESAAEEWSVFSARRTAGGWAMLGTPKPTGATASDLRGVSCVSASFCLATGWFDNAEGPHSLSMVYSNGSWQWPWEGSTSAWNAFQGVSCTSSTFCVVGGSTPERWNGSAWSAMPTPTPSDVNGGELFDVSCVSEDRCTAVGSAQDTTEGIQIAFVEDWNGTSWSEQASPRPQASVLEGVSCSAGEGCTAVGSSIVSVGWESLILRNGPASAPVAETAPTSQVSQTEATLNGAVSPAGAETKYHFEYGTTTAYGSSTPETTVGTDAGTEYVHATISGLQPNTTYHFRLVASNGQGVSYGADAEVRTASAGSS